MFYKSAHLRRVSKEIMHLSSRNYSLWKQQSIKLKCILFPFENRDILYSRFISLLIAKINYPNS